MKPAPPKTPDGRYIVVRGRLWRAANPALPPQVLTALTHELMDARRAVKAALHAEDRQALAVARAAVQTAKERLGERGEPWWKDAPDYNRHLVRNTPYLDWWEATGPNATTVSGES